MMQEIKIIRKGSYKIYLKNGIIVGIIIGIISFLYSLVYRSASESIPFGIGGFLCTIFVVMGIIFLGQEYLKRKIIIDRLKSKKYSFLHENDFEINDDLFFEGIYNNFSIRIFPMTELTKNKKEIEYDVIEAYYRFPDNDPHNAKREQNISAEYYFGKLFFANNCVSFIPKDWQKPNFEENINNLLSIFSREKLEPYSTSDWKLNVGEKLQQERKKEIEDDEQARTRQVLKIGKLIDIRYIKSR